MDAGKNLTTTTFWFYVDSLYFSYDPYTDVKNEIRKHDQFYHHDFDELEDLEFILKTRKLVSEEKMGTLNINDIRSTPIDEVITVLERHLHQVQRKNN